MKRPSKAAVGVPLLMGILLGALLIAPQAEAYNTYNNHNLTFGVTNQKYWLDSSAVTHNENAIVDGVGNWNAASGVPVSYSRTYTQSQSRLDFYRIDNNDSYCSVTRMYIDTSVVDPNDSNWWWAKVNNRPQLKDTDACGGENHRQGIMAHEMGHAMGLAHVNNNNRLMYDGIASTSINNPQQDDRDGINHLY